MFTELRLSSKKKQLDEFPIINRELSWLEFNERVLNISLDKIIPLFERVKFLSIFASNLNEFFMIRVAGIKDQIEVGYTDIDRSGLTPTEVLQKIKQKTTLLHSKEFKSYTSILADLEQNNYYINKVHTEDINNYLKYVFDKDISIVLSPITITNKSPIPFIPNLRTTILVKLLRNNEHYYGIVIIPENIDKIFRFESNNKTFFFTNCFIIEKFISSLFHGYEIIETAFMKITRNADLDIEEEGAEDLLRLIEESLDKRRKGGIVRLELITNNQEIWKNFLMENLDFEESDIYFKEGLIDPTVLFKINSNNKKFYFKEFEPYTNQFEYSNIFESITKQPIILYRPYNDFSLVVKLVKEAISDINTLAIKITIYRVNNDSEIIKALIEAAKKGISVSVIVELRARFDEENNLELAKKLENAGCIVTYGYPKHKVHTKLLLIVKKENGQIKSYAHLSTGNYNEKTARLYTDIDYLTSEEEVVEDVKEIFNFIMGYTELTEKKRVFIAPFEIKQNIIKLIEQEINNVSSGNKGKIIIKVNSLIDKTLINKIYEASAKGVEIKLIVRGICGIYTNLSPISDNIEVISIVGRFLEHPRIFYFYNNGNEEVFISSADFMERNMDRRIEAMTKITDKESIKKIKSILNLNLKDNVNSYTLIGNKYHKKKAQKSTIDSQTYFIDNQF
ncbi:MAG: ppk [Deferribacteraceae bacterium]|jgi:polyphosphate kinase|nr:ppk [Deferribacteraceae bacterium]